MLVCLFPVRVFRNLYFSMYYFLPVLIFMFILNILCSQPHPAFLSSTIFSYLHSTIKYLSYTFQVLFFFLRASFVASCTLAFMFSHNSLGDPFLVPFSFATSSITILFKKELKWNFLHMDCLRNRKFQQP